MIRAAYVTPFSCGRGHAVRGAALARAGVGVRAFGPPIADAPAGYEGVPDPLAAARDSRPDLLLVDLWWNFAEELRAALRVPAWLLLRYLAGGAVACPWPRRLAIEPAAAGLPGVTEQLGAIVGPQRIDPPAGAELTAGYNTWWEAVRYGYHGRVRWLGADHPERGPRIRAPLGPTDGAERLVAMIASG